VLYMTIANKRYMARNYQNLLAKVMVLEGAIRVLRMAIWNPTVRFPNRHKRVRP